MNPRLNLLALALIASFISQVRADDDFLAKESLGKLKLNQGVETKSCDLVKQAKDMFVEAQIMLPRGGATYVDQMRTLMGAVMQLDPYADDQIKTLCK